MKLSIIVPAYNETARIDKTLKKVYEYLSSQYNNFEICVVDDGSTDNTPETVTGFSETHPEVKLFTYKVNSGKGYAIRHGLKCGSGDILVFLDADLAVPVFELGNIVSAIQNGADIAIGARYQNDSMKKLDRTPLRNFLSRGFNLLTNFLIGISYRDTQCGLKGMTLKTAGDIIRLSNFNRFGFDVEWLWIAHCLGKNIVEVPVSYTDIKGSKIHVLRTSFYMFLDVMKLFFRRLTGYYEKRI